MNKCERKHLVSKHTVNFPITIFFYLISTLSYVLHLYPSPHLLT